MRVAPCRGHQLGVLLGVVVGLYSLRTGPALQAQADPAVTGSWSGVQNWPIVAVHTHLLPTGKVLFYPYADDAREWDPATGTISTMARVGYSIFCTGHSFLPDGRLLVTGGHIANSVGLNDASIYDPAADAWSRQPDMNAGRWYPTNTTLADGSVLVVSGDVDTTVGVNRLPQIWKDGAWRDLSTAQRSLPLYPMMFLAPNGKVFNAGPQELSRYLDTSGTGLWTSSATSAAGNRSYGTAVLYDVGKVLLVGGNDPPTSWAEVIDLNAPAPSWRRVASMATARRQLNATLLPDGTVLVTGGSSGAGFDNANAPVFTAELWNPATELWTTLSSATQYRGYHSTALLLPDGRVLSAGGDNHPNAELFSPPYLFKGSGPVVQFAPATANYGQTFWLGSLDGPSVTAVTLVRLSSVTHSFNMDQRFLRLTFTPTAGGLNVTAPSVPEVAPPGYYMLFLVNGAGVPSVGRMLRLGSGLPVPPIAASDLVASAVSAGAIGLSWSDNAANEDGFQIERSSDNVTFVQVATVEPNVTTYENTGLAASTTYGFRVRAFNGAGFSSYAGPVSATTLAPPPQLPSAPTTLVASFRRSRIALSWIDTASNEQGFRVERSSNGLTFGLITTLGPNATTYIDASYGASKFVYYRVQAYNAAGGSGFSNVVKVRVRH